MNPFQEPKYKIVGQQLVNRQSGEAIPEDEPVIVFRARDVHSAKVLAFYLSKVKDPFHREAVFLRLQQFHDWATRHPERMKEPDTQLTSDWKRTYPPVPPSLALSDAERVELRELQELWVSISKTGNPIPQDKIRRFLELNDRLHE